MKVAIVGVGKLGYKIAEALVNEDIDITIVDKNQSVIEAVKEHLDVLSVEANGLQVGILKELNIQTYDVTIAVTNSDETNIIICSLAKKLGCKKTVARIRNPEYAREISFIKSEMGIDYVVNPELATANEIIRYLLQSYTFYSGNFAKGRVLVVDFKVANLPAFIGKRIMDIHNIDNMLITAILRDNKIIIPNGSTILNKEDIIYIIGKKENIDKLKEECSNIYDYKDHIKKVMVFGGSKIGYYLSKKLNSLGIYIKLIERDRQRCEYLSEKLNNTLIICGDGTDANLLEEEDLNSTDAFIGVTGYDEVNMLMALMAKQSGVKKVIAKVSRKSYSQIVERLDIDAVVNPVDITASDILKFIRGGKVVSVSLLLGGQAEVVEIIASENLSVIGKPLSKLNLPKGVIIGAIVHDGKVVIPNGDSVIMPGDRFVVFCLMSEIPVLKKLFTPKKGGPFSELRNYTKGVR